MRPEIMALLGTGEIRQRFRPRRQPCTYATGKPSPQLQTADKMRSRFSTGVWKPIETSTSKRGLTKRADMATKVLRNSTAIMNIVSESTSTIDAESLDLQPDPIPIKWILEGRPEARVTRLLTSRDWASTVVVWECTPGSFKWHYSKDETVFFLSGEAFMTDENDEEHRFGAGDIACIAAGTSCRWRVTEPIRKIAVVRETIWRPLGFVLKVSKKLFRGKHSEVKTNGRPANFINTN